MNDKLLTVDEVAEFLSIAPSTLRNKDYRQKIGLNSIRVGTSIRFSKRDLENFVSRNIEALWPKPDTEQQ